MKKSHIMTAWISTMIGIVTGLLTTAAVSLQQGEFTWKAVLAGAAPAILLALTDFLKEVQKSVSDDSESTGE